MAAPAPPPRRIHSIDGAFGSGDLLFFRGNSLLDRLAEWWVGSEQSHVGMVLKDRHGVAHLWQSIDSPYQSFYCQLTRRRKSGPQLTLLAPLLEKTNHQVFHLPLNHRHWGSIDDWYSRKRFVRWLEQTAELGHYPANKLWINVWNSSDPREFFCSSLMVETYRQLEVPLAASVQAKNFMPKDLLPLALLDTLVFKRTNARLFRNSFQQIEVAPPTDDEDDADDQSLGQN